MTISKQLEKIIVPQSDSVRELWLEKQLSRLPKRKKILDAGAGECYYRRYCQHLQYVSQDLADYDGKGNRKGIQTGKRDYSALDIVSDIVNIPVKSKSFDAVLCAEVFEHLPAPLDALKEISRVLADEGTLLLTAPFTSLTHYSPYYYYSGFSINFYKENLPKYGFKIEEIYTYGNYFDYLALELLRTPLVCWRTIRFFSIPILLIYPIAIPVYILLRLLAIAFPDSQELLNFGHCIRARKKSSMQVIM